MLLLSVGLMPVQRKGKGLFDCSGQMCSIIRAVGYGKLDRLL